MAKTLRELAAACELENNELLSMVEPSVAAVLNAFGVKNVALMREISYACGARDISSPAMLLIGLPMLGWAPGAEGLMDRTKPPNGSMKEFLETRMERNEKIQNSTRASSDAKLDEEAYTKTIAETECGVLVGPFGSLQEVPFDDVALVPRHGIWEQHGEAIAPSCRCIDDMLQGCQNDTVGTVSSHRPTDPDGLVSQVRAVRRRC